MLNKFKIVILSDWFYPSYKAGGPITSLTNLVKSIGDSVNVSVLTSAYDLGESKVLDSVIPNEWQILSKDTRIKYLTKNKMAINELEKEEFDIIYLNSMFSPAFTLKPLFFTKKRRILNKIILAPRGMLAEGALSIKPIKKKLFLVLFKYLGIHKQIFFHATSVQEVDDIKKVFGDGTNITLVPNFPGVIDNYSKVLIKNKFELKLISVARIAEEKNTLFLLELLKSIKGNVTLNLLGMIKSKTYLNSCNKIISNLPLNIKVNVNGGLPLCEIKNKLNENHFFILPTLGENFGHAIYEALSTGTPVIISDKTPWQNLEQKNAGWDIALNKPEKFIEVLNHCAAMDNGEYQKWSEGAYNFAKKYNEDNDVTEKYLEMFGVARCI